MEARFSEAEIKEARLDDFRVFLCHVWAYLRLPKPTPVQLDIAHNLQHGPKRQIIEGYRGVGKSWITVAFVLWTLFLNPQAKVMVVSAGEQLAGDFTKFCMQLINGMPLLAHLKPGPDQRNSAVAFDVAGARESKDPSVKSVGITGQLTGSRADLIIADDIETPKNSYTHLLRERLATLVQEFDAVIKPLDSSKIIYLGTPQIEGSLYNRLRERGYEMRIWPAEVPLEVSKYGGRLAPYIQKLLEKGAKPGTPVDPKRFTEVDLMERKASYGRAGYALQFMLDTSPADAERFPLKLKDLIVMDCDAEMAHVKLVWGSERDLTIQDLDVGGLDGDRYQRPAYRSPEMSKYAGTVMYIDPSGKGKDETAYAVVRFAHGMLFLVASGGFLDGFGETTLSTLAGIAARYKVGDVLIEENYGGGMFNQLLKPHLVRVGWGRYPTKEEWNGWSSTQKELRILDTLEPIFQNHRLVVSRDVIEKDLVQQREAPQYSLVHQMTRMARIKGALPHEDRLEALAGACAYFVERMDRDKNKALELHKKNLMDAEIRKYMDHVMGRQTPSRLKWN